MRAPANPPAKPLGRLALIFVALMLATVSITTPAKADEPSGDGPEASGQMSMDMPLSAILDGERAAGVSDQDGDGPAPQDAGLASGDAPTLASYLSGGMLRVSADVALVDGDDEAIEPVVGSFTVDGLTYAIMEEGQVALVAVSPRTLADGLVGGSDVGSDAEGAIEPATLALPDAVSYDGIGYSLTAIGPRALAGCEAAAVALPASVGSVDPAAFEGSSVASVEVAEGNPAYSSYDGMLFDAGLTRLLLIPEGKQGAARLPSTAEEVDPSRFSHSAGVSSISVDAGCAAYLSRNGCLYDASGETLLRVPPGIADVEVVDGCRALGPRALEGCASLRSIAAPATVTDVSPDASAPDPSAVTVSIPKVTPREVWEARGFSVEGGFSIEERKGAGERPSEGLAAEEPDDIPLAALGAAQVSNGGPSTVTLRTGLGRSDINDDNCYFEEVINDSSGSVTSRDSVRPTVTTYNGEYFIASGNKRFSYFRTAADKAAKRYCHATPYRYGAKAGAYDIYCGKDGTEDTGYDIAEGASNEWYNGPHKDHPNMTLQVKWVEAPKYTITLDHTGGTSSLANLKAWRGWEFSLETPSFSSKPIHDIETPSKTGYAFAGYFTGRDGTGTQYVDATGKIVVDSNDVKKSVTVYAHWVSASTVSFNANGGTGGQSAAVTAVKGQDMPAISTTAPTRTGYTFGGWYDTSASSGGTQYYTAEGKSARTWDKDGGATLYARWTANTYSVALDRTGGTGGTAGPVTATFGQAMPKVEPPTRAGYRFLGYFNAQDVRYYNADGTSARDWDGGVNWTIFAHWEANVVTVHANGHPLAWSWVWRASGSDPIADRKGGDVAAGGSKQVVAAQRYYPTEGRSLVVDEVIPNSWYHFTGNAPGWTLVGFSKGSPSAAALSQGFYGEGSADLYAKWEPGIYKVALDKQGGTGGADAFWLKYAHHASSKPDGSDNIGSLASRPTRAGYSFMGYFTEPGGKGTRWVNPDGGWAIGSTACTSDTTLYALWQPNVYEVALDKQGGTGGTDRFWLKYAHWASLTEGGPDNCNPLPSLPTRTGYSFAGYFTEPGGKGSCHIAADGRLLMGNTAYASNATLYARWEAVPYGISYDCAGGMLPENARGSYSIEDGFDLPAPIRYGYQFDGWDVSGVAEGGSAGPVLGAGVETVAGADGAKVTRVKAGTYGDLSCTARWTLRYDLDVPVCDPGSVTFEADSLTGQVRVKPGTSAEGAILSYMAVPVALDSLSCEGLDSSGAVDPAGGAPELEAIFGAGSAAKVRFAATLGEGDAARTAKVTAGGASATASLAGLSIPAAASHDAPGRIKVSYGLELDSDLPIPPVRDAAPVARLAYTVSLPGAGA